MTTANENSPGKPEGVITSPPARCEWWYHAKTRSGIETTCPNAAAWQHVIYRRGNQIVWILCDQHKRLVLDSYNPAWRSKEEPEWTPIVPPNSKVSNPVVAVQAVVVPMGKRAARRIAKLKAAVVLRNLIMDGEFEDHAIPMIWSFINKLRAQKENRHNAGLTRAGDKGKT